MVIASPLRIILAAPFSFFPFRLSCIFVLLQLLPFFVSRISVVFRPDNRSWGVFGLLGRQPYNGLIGFGVSFLFLPTVWDLGWCLFYIIFPWVLYAWRFDVVFDAFFFEYHTLS